MKKRTKVTLPPFYFNYHTIPDEFEHFIGYTLSYTAQMMHLQVDAALAPLEIDSRQFGVIILISETEHRSQAAISENMGLDKAHVMRLVQNLEQLGYVYKLPNELDKRYYDLFLSSSGQAVLEKAKALAIEVQADIFKGFSQHEHDTLKELLAKLARDSFSVLRRDDAGG